MKMKLKCLACNKTFLYAAKLTSNPELYTIESHVCPYCQSRDIDELVEPQPEIYSLRKAALEEVDGLINIGYMVHSVFANHAILVKKEEKKP